MIEKAEQLFRDVRLAASLDSKYAPVMPRAPEHNGNHNADHDNVEVSARPVSMPRALFTAGLVKKHLLAHDTLPISGLSSPLSADSGESGFHGARLNLDCFEGVLGTDGLCDNGRAPAVLMLIDTPASHVVRFHGNESDEGNGIVV